MRIKKLLITLGLGLVLLAAAGAPALANVLDEDHAQGAAEISGSLASRYTVEIPADIAMGTLERNKDVSVFFSVTARNVILGDGGVLDVHVAGDGRGDDGDESFQLKNKNSFITYHVWRDNPTPTPDEEISPNGIFATFQNGIDSTGETQNGFISVRPVRELVSGTYRGNLTFTCDIDFPPTP